MTPQTKEHLISAALTFISGFVVVYGAFIVDAQSLSDLWAPAGVAALSAAVLAGIRAVSKLIVAYFSGSVSSIDRPVTKITLDSVKSNTEK